MRKTIIYILTAMVLLAGCDKNEFVPVKSSDDTITLTLSVKTPEASPMTKTMGETPDITSLHIAIFDEGGYPVSYVQATGLTKVTDNSWNYTVSLPTSGDPRTLHFIANSPITEMGWEYEDNAIGNLVTTGKNDAYWQKKVLANGIQPKEQALEDIGTVELVRNFAKITVQAEPNSGFTLASMKVFNVPDKGYVAPKYEEGSFVEDYNGTLYETLVSSYKGRTPENATMVANSDSYITAIEGITTDYIYERPLPTKDAPFIIVQGQYESSNYYYKIDLQDANNKYYPFLRNFRYKVDIKKVLAAGFATEEEAINSQGSGNITTVTEYEHVTNIGYGKGRLYVDKTGVTVQKAGAITVKYKFIPDVTDTPETVKNDWTSSSLTDATPVSITLSEPLVGTADAVSSSFDIAESDDTDGWRTVTLTATTPDPVYLKQQELIVLGKAVDGSQLQRKVLITVAPTFKLDVQCQKKVAGTKGTEMWVRVGLQDGLPESIFPVDINIEATKNSLTPVAGQSLPVATGKSMGNSEKPGYMFVRTITWEEYSSAPTYDGTADVNGSPMNFTFKAVECNFKTIVAASACDIWAGGNSYFNNDYCTFTNGTAYEFTNIKFGEALLGTTNKTTSLSFDAPLAKTITVTLNNGKWDNQSSFSFNASAGTNTIGGIVLGDYGTGITVTLSDGDADYNDKSYTGYRTALIPANSLSATIKSTESYNLNDPVTLYGGLIGNENTPMAFVVSQSNGKVGTTPRPEHDVKATKGTDNDCPTVSATYDNSTNKITVTIEGYNSSNTYKYNIGSAPADSRGTTINSSTFTINWGGLAEEEQGRIYVAKVTREWLVIVPYNDYHSSYIDVTDITTDYDVYEYTISGPVSETKIPLTGNVTENTDFSFKWLYNNGWNTSTATTKMENISTETVTNLVFI